MKIKRMVALTLLTCLLMGCQQANETAKDDQSTVELIQTDDSWGIVLSATDISNTGLTLVCSQNGGEITGKLQTGEKYWLEEKVDGQWQELSIPEKPVWQDEAYTIETQNLTQWDIQWTNLYGTLSQGEYRIGKEIQDFRGGSDYDEKAYYAEFVIE